jgi:hypothetical protein
MFKSKHRWPALLVVALGACGSKKPVTPPAPTPPSAAQEFIAAFNKAESSVEPAAQALAQKCATTATFVSCALISAAPSTQAPAPLTLILSLGSAGAITATTIEGAPTDDARLFGALSAVAVANGEPLSTNATIAAFRHELGLSGKPKLDRPAVAHRTYADITCVSKESGLYACTFAPAVTEGDLPAPQLTSAHGSVRAQH